MKKLWYSYTKELKLASKGFYFYVEIVMAILIIFVLLFVVPEEMGGKDEEYITLEMPEAIESYYREAILEEDLDGAYEQVELKLGKEMISVDLSVAEDRNIYLIPSKEDMIALTKADRPLIGAHIYFDASIGDEGELVYDYYTQGYESERLKNLFRILHVKDLRPLADKAELVEVRELKTVKAPLNSREIALPSLMTFNGSLMGLFIVAAYIFLDKEEGVIKAYAVTASKVWQYLMSKVLVMTTVTIVSTTVIAFAIMGLRPNYPALLVLLITSSFAGSSFGLLISSFYDNMTKAFAALYVAMMLMMMPAIAYFMPSWQPAWVKIIPTHFIIQGFKDIIINEGSMNYVWLSSAGFLVAGIIIFVMANYKFKRKLTT